MLKGQKRKKCPGNSWEIKTGKKIYKPTIKRQMRSINRCLTAVVHVRSSVEVYLVKRRRQRPDEMRTKVSD